MTDGCLGHDHFLIARRIAPLKGRSIVAIDGVDGAGKTTFADGLAKSIESLGTPVLRASIDGFHNPRAVRYRRGKSDPLGYFLDSYNYAEFVDHLVTPFRIGAETVSIARFEHLADTERPVTTPVPKEMP